MTTVPTALPRLKLRSPDDILAAAPYLLGFHPSDSLVALGVRGRWLRFHVRGDLPADGDEATIEPLADHYAALFQRQRIDGVVLIGYGSPDRVDRCLAAIGAAMRHRGIEVLDLLRVHDGRYRSLHCASVECCPAEGWRFDVSRSAVAASATVAGLVALPDREAVVRSLAGPEGAALVAIERATDSAGARFVRLADAGDVADAAMTTGRVALDEAVERYRAGDRLADEEVAWLSLLLQLLPVRDEAWLRIDRDGVAGREVHERLWVDLVRRCDPALVPPVAMLLAYLTWRAGDGLRASIAVDRALAVDPNYSGALLMAEILNRGLPPSRLPPVGRSGPARRRGRAARRRKR